MTAKPTLPDGYDLPEQVNGWMLDRDSNKNGHTWYAPDRSAAVGVFETAGDVYAKALDERVSGFGRGRKFFECAAGDAPAGGPSERIGDGIEAAVRWMDRHDPSWTHPAVEPAAFDPPPGFVRDRYYLEQREHIVCYRQTGTESAVGMSGRRVDTEPSLETRKYLYVTAWRGSGNATIALAPWLRAHDHELHEVVDCPPACGLDVALMLAREWVCEQTGVEDSDAGGVGQQALSRWAD